MTEFEAENNQNQKKKKKMIADNRETACASAFCAKNKCFAFLLLPNNKQKNTQQLIRIQATQDG